MFLKKKNFFINIIKYRKYKIFNSNVMILNEKIIKIYLKKINI